jgi:TetR/AcrR family transcriptional regulator, regulator of cefoperazone and chloramphenicol sensitivity
LRSWMGSMYGDERPTWHVKLMTHELAHPTPALPGVVDQVTRPRYDSLRRLVAGIIGRSPDDRLTRLCVHSIIGQASHYGHARRVIERLWPDLKFTPQTLDEIADHIAAFSYAAMRRYASPRKLRAHGAPRRPKRKAWRQL